MAGHPEEEDAAPHPTSGEPPPPSSDEDEDLEIPLEQLGWGAAAAPPGLPPWDLEDQQTATGSTAEAGKPVEGASADLAENSHEKDQGGVGTCTATMEEEPTPQASPATGGSLSAGMVSQGQGSHSQGPQKTFPAD